MQMVLQYDERDSVLHRMDPITKFLWIVLLGVSAFVISAPEVIAILLVVVIATGLALGRVPFERFVKGSILFWILGSAAGFFQLMIRTGGQQLLSIGPVDITTEGVRFGITFAMRIALIATASLFYVWTTDPKRLVLAAVYLRVPYRIAFSLLVALRFVPLVEQEARVIREAQALRGVEQHSGKLEAIKRYVLPLLASAMRRSERTAIAMEARGFGYAPTRTYLEQFAWTRAGVVLLIIYAGIISALIYMAAGIEGGLLVR